ncbi:hypothetical protein TH24_11310 [Thalassospira xiamenensis]|nr:hypothetical protein TH24_11310 [Thalassospira xiamenensis]
MPVLILLPPGPRGAEAASFRAIGKGQAPPVPAPLQGAIKRLGDVVGAMRGGARECAQMPAYLTAHPAQDIAQPDIGAVPFDQRAKAQNPAMFAKVVRAIDEHMIIMPGGIA